MRAVLRVIGAGVVVLGLLASGARAQTAAPAVAPDDLQAALQAQGAALRVAMRNAGGLLIFGMAQYVHGIGNSLAAQGRSLATPRETVSLVAQDPRYQENAAVLFGIAPGTPESSNRIWGGLSTNGYRTTLALRIKGGGLCTGVAIAVSTVLTAAHCVCAGVEAVDEVDGDIDHIAVRHLPSGQQPARPTMRGCQDATRQPADVGLVRFDGAVPPDNPVVFGTSATIDAAPFVRAVGFGESQTDDVRRKRYVDIPVASPNCGGVVKLASGQSQADQTWYGCTPTFELVAGQSHLDRDTCHGDSGGPIFVHVDDGRGSYREYLAGITARGIASAGARDCGDGGIYTRVDRDVAEYIRGQGVAVQVQN